MRLAARLPTRRLQPLLALARRELGAVAALLVVALSGYAFLALSEEVSEGETALVDRRVLLALRSAGDPSDPIGPHWLEVAAADITALGSIAVLTLLVLLLAGLFTALSRKRDAAIILLAAGTGVALSQGLKQLFGRERPDMALRAVEAMNPSFPSGHAMLSAVVFLTVGALAARFARRRRVKAYALAAAVTATLLVGMTRVYLGVHWPSDVLAGWSLGAGWAMACWLAAWALEKRWASGANRGA
jgi:undecaprenyl-diphosphatase